jgi:hypothetical protein
MTPSDLEAMVQNLNHRATRIEQILATLASKSDLEAMERRLRAELASKSDLEALRKELRHELAEGFGDARRYALVLHEDLKSDLGLIAEHLSDVMSRLPPRAQ